jgi:hypothetical protein
MERRELLKSLGAICLLPVAGIDPKKAVQAKVDDKEIWLFYDSRAFDQHHFAEMEVQVRTWLIPVHLFGHQTIDDAVKIYEVKHDL